MVPRLVIRPLCSVSFEFDTRGTIPTARARIFTRAGANPKLACEILGVTPGTKLAKLDVKRAYRAGMVANHPDKGRERGEGQGDHCRFQIP